MSEPSVKSAWVQVALSILSALGVIAATFILAGRWDWVQAWLFYGVFFTYCMILVLWIRRTDPDLMRERQKSSEPAESWDRVVMAVYTIMLFVLFVVAALDGGRFCWSTVPLAAQIGGWVGLAAAGTVIWHVMTVNAYLSSYARIQDERDHQVVSRGLYRHVRHPMYLAIMIGFVSLPLVLASFWSMIPACIIVGLFIYRTVREDRMLMTKLPGYSEYAECVRYRLLPGVW